MSKVSKIEENKKDFCILSSEKHNYVNYISFFRKDRNYLHLVTGSETISKKFHKYFVFVTELEEACRVVDKGTKDFNTNSLMNLFLVPVTGAYA